MSQAPTRVAIVSTRDLADDPRVPGSAVGLARTGLEVTVFAPSVTSARSITRLGAVRIVRVPMPKPPKEERSPAARGIEQLTSEFGRRMSLSALSLAGSEGGASWERHNVTRIAELHLRIKAIDQGPIGAKERVHKKLLWERIRARQQLVHVRRSVAQRERRLARGGRPDEPLIAALVARVRSGNWRTTLPLLREMEVAMGPLLDELAPRLFWATDAAALVLCRDAAVRLRSKDVNPSIVYDLRDELPTGQRTASALVEAALLPQVDGLLSSSDDLQQRGASLSGSRGALPSQLAVTAPASTRGASSSIRNEVGVGDDVPLFAHLLEGLNAASEVAVLVDLLSQFPDAHLALIVPTSASPDAPALTSLGELAATAGAVGRFHVLDRPDSIHLVAFLRGATAAIQLEPSWATPRTSVPYPVLAAALADVPLIVTPGSAAAAFVNAHGLGTSTETATADGVDLAAAVVCIQKGDDWHASTDLTPLGWEHQVDQVVALAAEVLDLPLALQLERPEPAAEVLVQGGDLAPGGAVLDRRPLLGIGPRNGNGQAWAWAEALRATRPDVDVEVFVAEFRTGRLDMAFPCNVSIGMSDWRSTDWQLRWTRHVLTNYTHVLLEQGLTALGRLTGRHFYTDLPLLEQQGIQVGLVFRGSELRDPRAHAAREPHSPFSDPEEPLTQQLQRQVDHLRPHIDALQGPTFVTTLDLLDDLPGARWLPQVLDLAEWPRGEAPLQHRVPVVLHAPSKERMKGSDAVDAVCVPLAEQGLIDYRRVRGVPYREMPRLVREADVLVDQFRLGSYGVIALQAMATGRLVIGHVRDSVRNRLSEPLPVMQAEPNSLHGVLTAALADRDHAREVASAGHDYVSRYHDGRHSASALSALLRAEG